MAAAEEQEQRVVTRLGGGRGPRFGLRRLLAAPASALASSRVDEPPARHGGEPRPRIARRVLGPRAEGLDQRLLQRVLGCVEVLAAADETREDMGDEGAQGALVQLCRGRCDRSSALDGTFAHQLADGNPLVERLAAGPGLGGDVGGDLDGALV